MAKKGRQHDVEAWKNAKKICRLNVRQVKMARALGMNPKKLPGLRPSPQQRWKLPVGKFIEECYWKRFGGDFWDNEPREPKPASRKPSIPPEHAHAPGSVRDPMWQAQDLICSLTNLADDLRRWLAHGTVAEVLPQVQRELREIANAIDTGASIPQVSAIPPPLHQAHAASSGGDSPVPTFDDDIPF